MLCTLFLPTIHTFLSVVRDWQKHKKPSWDDASEACIWTRGLRPIPVRRSNGHPAQLCTDRGSTHPHTSYIHPALAHVPPPRLSLLPPSYALRRRRRPLDARHARRITKRVRRLAHRPRRPPFFVLALRERNAGERARRRRRDAARGEEHERARGGLGRKRAEREQRGGRAVQQVRRRERRERAALHPRVRSWLGLGEGEGRAVEGPAERTRTGAACGAIGAGAMYAGAAYASSSASLRAISGQLECAEEVSAHRGGASARRTCAAYACIAAAGRRAVASETSTFDSAHAGAKSAPTWRGSEEGADGREGRGGTCTPSAYSPAACSPSCAPRAHAAPAAPLAMIRGAPGRGAPAVVNASSGAGGTPSSSSSDSYACRGGAVSARGSTFYACMRWERRGCERARGAPSSHEGE
jgi:hypothetical protein